MAKKRGKNEYGIHEMVIRSLVNDILNGATLSVMITKLTEGLYAPNEDAKKDYIYTKMYAHRLVMQARDRIKADTDEMIPSLREDALNRMLDVYTECRELGDRMNAIKALDNINKLMGLYENKVNLQGTINQDITISFGLSQPNNEDDENEENG